MPSTAAHIPVQALATRLSLPSFDHRWMLLGCVVPDIPWMLQRVLHLLPLSLDARALRVYCIVQASLFFTLVAAGGLALLARHPRRALATLSIGALVHLLLDGLETKWGNAPHLLAPARWSGFELDLFWPEHPASYLLAALGLGYLVLTWWRPSRTESPLDLSSPLRSALAVSLLAVYLAAPPLLSSGPLDADSHYVRTLGTGADRTEAYLELDRARYLPGADRGILVAYTGERIPTTAALTDDTATVSVKGRFTPAGRLAVRAYHVHHPFARDALTLLGLAGIAAVWLRGLIPRRPG